MTNPKFKPGDVITRGLTYFTIQRVTRTSYQLTAGNYVPISLTDRLWTLAEEEPTIEE